MRAVPGIGQDDPAGVLPRRLVDVSRVRMEQPDTAAGASSTESPSGSGRIAAAIVNFNTRDHLDRCLRSLEREPLSQLIVVDNASTDGSQAVVEQRTPRAHLIANATNTGYGAAGNQALREARSEYLLLLNADTEVRPGAIAQLAAYLDAHPDVAIAAPRLEDGTGATQTSCFPFPGTRGWLFENGPLTLWTRLVPWARERSVSFRTSLDSRAVPWALGAALFVRREAALAVGAFDESYFMYFEEVDLCYRLALAGWETHFVPAAVVMHVGGASTSQVRAEMLIQRFSSTIDYYRRHSSGLTRAFWTSLVRLRWVVRLVRDSAKLLVTVNPEKREHLRSERSAWWAASFARPLPPVLAKPRRGPHSGATPGAGSGT